MNRAIRHHIGIVVFIPFNRPQLGFRLKYFIRLARIGIAYCAEAGGRKAEFGKKMRNTKKQSKSQAERSQLFIGTHNETLSVVAVCVGSCQGRIPCFKRIIFWGNDCVGPAVRRGGFYLKPVLIFIDRIGLVPVEFPAPASHLIFPHHHARCRTSRTWFYDDTSNVIETHQHFGNFKEWFCSVTACRILTCS